MIDTYVILTMPFNFILSSNLSSVLSKYPVFIMAMPLNIILVMYVIQLDNLVKTCTYISPISMTNKSVMTSFLSIKYLSVSQEN